MCEKVVHFLFRIFLVLNNIEFILFNMFHVFCDAKSDSKQTI